MRASIFVLALLIALTHEVCGQTAGTSTMEGVITLVDTNRNLLVIQDRDQSRAIKLPSLPSELRVGERVVINGKVSPYFSASPDYPNHPSGRSILPELETPADWEDHFLVRLRGFLQVPTDGNYTFWVAADDEAELWLGVNSEVATAKKIISVSSATRVREWERDAEQKSQSINLKAGERYYLEARQREWRGHDHLSVAWRGPGFERRVIGGANLLPWPSDNGATNGILCEYWTNSYLTRLAMLSPKTQEDGVLRMDEVQVNSLVVSELPTARRLRMDRLADAKNFSWIELEGEANFIVANNGMLTFELSEANVRSGNSTARLTVRVLDWGNEPTVQLRNRKLRVRGVFERTFDTKGEPAAAIIWTANAEQISLLDFVKPDGRDLPVLPMFDLTPGNMNLAWGRKVLVRGAVMSSDAKSGTVTLRGEDSFYAYSSSNGTNWNLVGTPVPVAMGDTVYAGLAVSSVTNRPGTEATFSQVSADLARSQTFGLGSIPTSGSVTLNGASVSLRPSGGNDWDATDKGLFHYQKLTGDGEIVARLESFTTARVSDKAGLMMRESLNADAPYVALVMKNGTRLDLQYRGSRQTVSKAVDHVGSAAPQWLKLVRRQNTLNAQVLGGEKLRPRQTVELVGLLNWRDGEPVLMDAYVRPATRVPREVPTVAETHEVQIAELPSDVAESEQYLGENYLIRGVVTFMGRAFNRNLLFMQDETGGVLIRVSLAFFRSQRFEPGQLIEAKGDMRFSPGTPPFVLNTGSLLGWGELPPPVRYPNRANAKQLDGGWVEARGVVRSVTNNVMMVMEQDGLLPVWVGGMGSSNGLSQYIDSLVNVRGAFSLQVIPGPVLLAPSPGFIEVKEAAPPDPFIIPTFPINKVCAPDMNAQLQHRAKVSGVITYRDEQTLILQDETAGALVLGSGLAEAKVGDRVDVIGFPKWEGETVTLRESRLRKTGEGQLSKPPAMSLEGVLDSRLNCRLVRLEGVVLDQKIREGQQVLELQNGRRVFQAVLPLAAGRLENLPVGGRVQITGVNHLQFVSRPQDGLSERNRPLLATVEVLLRSPKDILLLQRPPWWNWQRMLAVVVALALVLTGSLVWIRTLRQRVEQRTRELQEMMGRLKKETEISATLAERDRLAAEIHDTFEQGLSGIMMQLDGVDARLQTDPGEAREFLEKARRMVRFNRSEVRQSLWNLESTLLQGGNLGSAIKEIARQMGAGNAVGVSVEIIGSAHPLPPTIEHHLLRCAQESLNNALKHAKATAIEIKLNYMTDAVELTVADNGCGFDPAAVMIEAGKSLGLRNLRSRSRKIKAQLEMTSAPGNGTTIKLTVSLGVNAEKSSESSNLKQP